MSDTNALPGGQNASAETTRLAEAADGTAPWRLWGPYLSERQWSTVREDYSPDGSAWEYFPHDHARSRAYRWGEDGLLGISDEQSRLCFALALWNGVDPILKERMFGLTGNQGNHGEDVKEYYFYLDSTPTHSFMKALYKYPQARFPYEGLVAENGRRDRSQPEYDLLDTGVFNDDRYFDVFVEYAKASADDIVIRITAANRGPDAAPLHLLPTLWFRNTWSWGRDGYKPELRVASEPDGVSMIRAVHAELGEYRLACEGSPHLLFTENETNAKRLWDDSGAPSFAKDAFHDAVVNGQVEATNPAGSGTKAAAHYVFSVARGVSVSVVLRLSRGSAAAALTQATDVLDLRRAEADAFYAELHPATLTDDERNVQRQALASLLWSKQFYYFNIDQWLDGDPASPAPPPERRKARNRQWRHLYNADIILMPDKWEYPWYAAWDLAFHCVTMAHIDPDFAKDQLVLMLREWYMHPNGQLPAYEWAFGDVNPPVHAWAALRVFQIETENGGTADYDFLERIFHKLLLNFTWWVNRKDSEGNNVFGGGFLGLDNIGVFDRSMALPAGVELEQSDGTAWMGMYCLNMLGIALQLAGADPVYEDVATKFFEHFMYIGAALNNLGGDGVSLWDEEDAFFYDTLHADDGRTIQLKVRSLVGLLPLLAVGVSEPKLLESLPEFTRRMEWFIEHRPDMTGLVARWDEPGVSGRRVVAVIRGERMKSLLARMLDPTEFLSDHGIRSISRYHLEHPYSVSLAGQEMTVPYDPAESTSNLFGGNSNWRGPVWFPINYLLIEALERFYRYHGDSFLVEHPTGSGQMRTLQQIADDLSQRLAAIFLRRPDGTRPVYGAIEKFQHDPHWRDHLLFHEYFHGDTGAGIGASHQTGWTALVANLLFRKGATSPAP